MVFLISDYLNSLFSRLDTLLDCVDTLKLLLIITPKSFLLLSFAVFLHAMKYSSSKLFATLFIAIHLSVSNFIRQVSPYLSFLPCSRCILVEAGAR